MGHTEHLDQFALTADTEVAKWTGQPGPWPVVWRHDKLSRKAALKFEVSLKRDKNTPRFYTRTGLTRPRSNCREPCPPKATPDRSGARRGSVRRSIVDRSGTG